MVKQFYTSNHRYWHIRVDSIFAKALLISLLLHLIVIFLLLPKIRPAPIDLNLHTLNVSLVPLPNSKKSKIAPKPVEPTPPPTIEKPIVKKPQKLIEKKLLTSPNSHDSIAPLKSIPEKPVTEKPPVKENNAANDVLAYLNARRQQRQASEATETAPSQENNIQDRLVPEQKRDEIIAKNLQPQGTNGLFQIREIMGNMAQYSFRGWQQDGRNSRFEIITVTAAADETIERAIVRSMIKIIREHYSGDFNWQSQRYGRIVVLSARKQDNQALEDFLLQEFFVLTGR